MNTPSPLLGNWSAAHIATQLERHLSLDSCGQPSLERAISRLFFIDENLVQAEQWEELEWLIQETKHFAQKRESKHPLLKPEPRRKLQSQVAYFAARAAIVSAAILSSIEARYLQRRGLSSNIPNSSPLDYPSTWSSLKSASDNLSLNLDKTSVLNVSKLLQSIIIPITHIIEHTQPSSSESDDPAESLAHFKWHSLEIAAQSSHFSFIQELKYLKQQNRLLIIALEKLYTLLNILRARLIEQSL